MGKKNGNSNLVSENYFSYLSYLYYIYCEILLVYLDLKSQGRIVEAEILKQKTQNRNKPIHEILYLSHMCAAKAQASMQNVQSCKSLRCFHTQSQNIKFNNVHIINILIKEHKFIEQ